MTADTTSILCEFCEGQNRVVQADFVSVGRAKIRACLSCVRECEAASSDKPTQWLGIPHDVAPGEARILGRCKVIEFVP